MKNKNSSMVKIVFIIIFGTLIGGGAYIFVSPQFEKKPPKILFESNGYWNLKDDLNIKLSDESGIKYYKIVFKNQENEKVLKTEVLQSSVQNLELTLPAPELNPFFKAKEVQIVVHAVDSSRWNFFEGNEVIETFDIKIDIKRPIANVIANSLAIRKGGSAVAVVKVEDENLESAYISFNNNEEVFALTPFYKEGYFVSLIAWDVEIENFEQVSIVATDKAGNITKNKIPLYIRPLKSKTDDINLSESFIKNVSANVLEQSHMLVPNDLKSIFLESNRVLRAQNIQTIKEDTRKYMNRSAITEFKVQPFRRLPGSRTAAGFAERRHYYLNGEKIDEAWHLGVDWASVKQASVSVSNPGRVIANKYVGIYGNTMIIDHGMGLASLYGHLSSTKVNAGDEVQSRSVIGQTGTTGAVLGDHLHFGVLVQGIEVNPLEWMDQNWIKTRITDILNEAKKVIDTQ